MNRYHSLHARWLLPSAKSMRQIAGFDESQSIFHRAMPTGFAWELLDVWSGCVSPALRPIVTILLCMPLTRRPAASSGPCAPPSMHTLATVCEHVLAPCVPSLLEAAPHLAVPHCCLPASHRTRPSFVPLPTAFPRPLAHTPRPTHLANAGPPTWRSGGATGAG